MQRSPVSPPSILPSALEPSASSPAGIPLAWGLSCWTWAPEGLEASPGGAPALTLEEEFEFPPLGLFVDARLPVPRWDAPAGNPSIRLCIVDVVTPGIPLIWEPCCGVRPPEEPEVSLGGAPVLKLKEEFEFPSLRLFGVARIPVPCWDAPPVNPSVCLGAVDVVAAGIPLAWELGCWARAPEKPEASPGGAPSLGRKEEIEFPSLTLFAAAGFPIPCWGASAVDSSFVIGVVSVVAAAFHQLGSSAARSRRRKI